MELQQSPLYQKYIRLLGWNVVRVDGAYIFLRHFPLIGALAKLQRPLPLPEITKIITILKKYKVRTLALEPAMMQDAEQLHAWCNQAFKHVRPCRTPFLPTKTILTDLTLSEKKIFARFSEAKRRAVRRAQKNGITIKQTDEITEFIAIKNKSAGVLGFITTTGLRQLWQAFAPQNAAILSAVAPNTQIVAGVLLLFWEATAYYWIAGATGRGKKLFAPTLLVWEALKLAKQRGMKQFDFVGVWDERTPRQNRQWHGFTRFKEGFGGKAVYYPTATPHK